VYGTAHSLSRLAHGRRPVAISRRQQPRDHISTAPVRPLSAPVITNISGCSKHFIPSGDIYIGVPVILLRLVRAAVVMAALVLPCLAKTLAAPKSENLILPTPSRRMSRSEKSFSRHTFWFDVAMDYSLAVEILETL